MNNSGVPNLPKAQQSYYEPTIKIEKIQPHYRFDANNMPRITCYFHADKQIKYFCRQQECLMPLCDECCKPHMDQQHLQTQSNIVPYEAILSEIYQNLAADCNEMCDQVNRIQQLAEQNASEKLVGKQSLQTNPIKLIDSARDQVITIVNNYFETLKTYLQTQIEEPLPEINVKPALKDLKLKWETNIKDLECINNPQTSIEKVIEYCEEELRKRNDKVMMEADQLLRVLETGTPQYRNYGVDIPQLHVDPSFLPRFLWVLERYAFFHRPPLEPEVIPIVEPVYELPPPPRYFDPYPPQEPLILREPVIIREPVFRDSLIRDEEIRPDYDEFEDYRRRKRSQERQRRMRDEDEYPQQISRTRERPREPKEEGGKIYKETITRETSKKKHTGKSTGPKEITITHQVKDGMGGSYMGNTMGGSYIGGGATQNYMGGTTVNQIPQTITYQQLPTQNALQPQINMPTSTNLMKKSKLTSNAYTKD